MNTLLYGSALVFAACLFTAAATTWHLYMFQLNHYIHVDHWRWMLRDPRNLRSVLMPLAAVVAGALIKSVSGGRITVAALLLAGTAMALGGFRKLKYTRRVKTLIVTSLIVEALVIWLAAGSTPPAWATLNYWPFCYARAARRSRPWNSPAAGSP